MQTTGRMGGWFLWLIALSCLVTITSVFYSFYLKKNYDFIVEASCDPVKEVCTHRDCSNPDFCPPNGLEDFKRYNLRAVDFPMCNDGDCSRICSAGIIECSSIECEENELFGETCGTPIPQYIE